MAQENETLIEFPCDFPIKVMGEAQADFINVVISLIQQHIPEFNMSQVATRSSSAGKYISLTCTVYVTSKPQLDAIYRALTSNPLVKYTL